MKILSIIFWFLGRQFDTILYNVYYLSWLRAQHEIDEVDDVLQVHIAVAVDIGGRIGEEFSDAIIYRLYQQVNVIERQLTVTIHVTRDKAWRVKQ